MREFIECRLIGAWALPFLAGLAIVMADSRPAQAVTCTQSLLSCYAAAGINGQDWLDMWARGLDCELDFSDCARRAVLGH